jgi:hypothetical protein
MTPRLTKSSSRKEESEVQVPTIRMVIVQSAMRCKDAKGKIRSTATSGLVGTRVSTTDGFVVGTVAANVVIFMKLEQTPLTSDDSSNFPEQSLVHIRVGQLRNQVSVE